MSDPLEEQLKTQLREKLAERGIALSTYLRYRFAFEEWQNDLDELESYAFQRQNPQPESATQNEEIKKQFEEKKKLIELKMDVVEVYFTHRIVELNATKQKNLKWVESFPEYETAAQHINVHNIHTFIALKIHDDDIHFEGFISTADQNTPLQKFQKFLKERSLWQKITDFFSGRHHLFQQYKRFLNQYRAPITEETIFLKEYQKLKAQEQKKPRLLRKYQAYVFRRHITTKIGPSDATIAFKKFNDFVQTAQKKPKKLGSFQKRVVADQHYFCARYRDTMIEMLPSKKDHTLTNNQDIEQQLRTVNQHLTEGLPGIQAQLKQMQEQISEAPATSQPTPDASQSAPATSRRTPEASQPAPVMPQPMDENPQAVTGIFQSAPVISPETKQDPSNKVSLDDQPGNPTEVRSETRPQNESPTGVSGVRVVPARQPQNSGLNGNLQGPRGGLVKQLSGVFHSYKPKSRATSPVSVRFATPPPADPVDTKTASATSNTSGPQNSMVEAPASAFGPPVVQSGTQSTMTLRRQ